MHGVDAEALGYADTVTLTALQGLLNRDGPELFVVRDDWDRKWLEYLTKRFALSPDPIFYDDLLRLADRVAQGYVVWDRHAPNTLNLAITLAGVDDLVVVEEGQVEVVEKMGLRCREDLRNRFRGWTRHRIYEWAFDRLMHRCAEGLVCCHGILENRWIAVPEECRATGELLVRIEGLKAGNCPRGAIVKELSIWGGVTCVARNALLDVAAAVRYPENREEPPWAVGPGRKRDFSFPIPDRSRSGDLHVSLFLGGLYTVAVAGRATGPWHTVAHKAARQYPVDIPDPDTTGARDLLVSRRIFAYYLSSSESTPEERELRGRIMRRIAPTGRVMGTHTDEERELDLLTHTSRHGNVIIAMDSPANLSFMQHLRPESISFPKMPTPPILDRTKIYVSFIVNDGDDGGICYRHMHGAYDDPVRGGIPVGWGMQLLLAELAPPMLAYYAETATEVDCFAASASGVGYSHADLMSPEDLDLLLQRTREKLEQTGLRVLQFYGYPRHCGGAGMTREGAGKYAEALGGLLLGVQDGYWCYRPGEDFEFERFTWAKTRLPNIDTGTSFERMRLDLLDMAQSEIRRPLFVPAHPFVLDGPTPTKVRDLAPRLPDEFVLVRPDHLFALMLEARSNETSR